MVAVLLGITWVGSVSKGVFVGGIAVLWELVGVAVRETGLAVPPQAAIIKITRTKKRSVIKRLKIHSFSDLRFNYLP